MRRAGNRVRVTAQLMNASDGIQLWSERYDRELDDIFAIQDEIARGIVEQLRVRLGLEQATAPLVARPTDDLEAYQLYLRGREAAVVADPGIAPPGDRVLPPGTGPRSRRTPAPTSAWPRRYIGLGVYQYIPTIEAAREAERPLQAAERIQPDLALVHVLWASSSSTCGPTGTKRARTSTRALAIDPNEPLAHAYIGI